MLCANDGRHLVANRCVKVVLRAFLAMTSSERDWPAAPGPSRTPPDVEQKLHCERIVPQYAPPFGRSLLDHAGRLWIELSEAGHHHGSWLVVDTGGSSHFCSIPSVTTLLYVTESEAVVVSTDDDGVEYVALHHLKRE
jgi:hypothetical protein